MGKLADLIVDQGDIRRIDRDIASDPAHGDPHTGFLQSGCVIDPVPDHADHFSVVLERLDIPQLVLRQTVCMDLTDPQLPRHISRRFLIVSCQQHRGSSGIPDARSRVRRILPQRI